MTSKLEAWLLHVFICHAVVLRRKRLKEDTVDMSLQVIGMVTASSPILILFLVAVAVLAPYYSWETLQFPFIIAVLIWIFGLSKITDRIYERHRVKIIQTANDILRDSRLGTWWAVKQLLRIWTCYLVAAVLIAWLGRLWYLAN